MNLTTIRLQAKTDTSGIPRRIYLVLDGGYPIARYEERYKGEDAITDEAHRAAYRGYTIDITVAEYKRLVRGFYKISGTTFILY